MRGRNSAHFVTCYAIGFLGSLFVWRPSPRSVGDLGHLFGISALTVTFARWFHATCAVLHWFKLCLLKLCIVSTSSCSHLVCEGWRNVERQRIPKIVLLNPTVCCERPRERGYRKEATGSRRSARARSNSVQDLGRGRGARVSARSRSTGASGFARMTSIALRTRSVTRFPE